MTVLCKDCKYWEPPRVLVLSEQNLRDGCVPERFGFCRKIVDSGLIKDAIAEMRSREESELYTASEFGCVAGERHDD